MAINAKAVPGKTLILREQPHDGLKVPLHGRWHVRALDAEVLEIGGRVDQHLAGAVVPIALSFR